MRIAVLSLLFITFLLPACAGRIPSDKKTAHLSRNYFKKYGKKYKETVFFKNPVQAAEIKRTQELQKDVATSFILLEMAEGQKIPIIITTIRKFPLGWRITGWEWVKK